MIFSPPPQAKKHSVQSSVTRVDWQDLARGIGIILVVYGHMTRGLMSSGALTGNFWVTIDFMIYTFHMPLFFFLSGLNVFPSRNKPGFFRKRAFGIIIPYLAFSLLQGSIQVILSGRTNSELQIVDILLIPLFPISPFWFLYVLLIFVGIISLWRPGWPMMAVAVAMTLLSPLANGASYDVAFQVLYFFSFYVAGILFRVSTLPSWVGLGCTGIWLIWTLVALKSGSAPHSYYAPYMLPATVAAIVAILWVGQLHDGHCFVLSYIGRNALSIYVMHILVTAGFRITLPLVGVHQPILHVIIGTVAGVIIPILVQYLLQSLSLSRLFGLPARS